MTLRQDDMDHYAYALGYRDGLCVARDCLLKHMPGKLGAVTPENVARYIDEMKAMRRYAEALVKSAKRCCVAGE